LFKRITLPFALVTLLVMLALGAYLSNRARLFLLAELQSIPPATVETGIRHLQQEIILAALTAAVPIISLAAYISVSMAHPLRQLTQTARSIAAADQPEASASRDEIGELARAVNQMSARLQGQISELDAGREKLAAILQQMSSGVVMVDAVGQIALLNRAAEKLLDTTEASALGKSLVETFRHHQIVETWQKTRTENRPQIIDIDLRPQSRTLQLISAPLRGVLTGSALLIFQDQTRLRQLETVRQDFISNISHELRTPLASLKALTETLLDGALDDPPAARRFLSRIEIEVDALALMVQELLELARIESGRVPLQLETIPPAALIDGAVERLYLQAERAGLTIQREIEPGLPAIQVDPPRMQQVLMNLLHNAIKFTAPGGTIILRARMGGVTPEGGAAPSQGSTAPPEGQHITFSVSDTGIGIPASDLSRIFERFYKTDRARASGGTGLGLAIARHMVEAHGGQIWAESTEERGSTFYFWLPVGRVA